MIQIHRLTQPGSTLYLNADQIVTVESTPDTVITIAGGGRLVVMETPEQLAEEVRLWRASIAAAVLEASPGVSRPNLTAIVSGPASGSHAVAEQRREE